MKHTWWNQWSKWRIECVHLRLLFRTGTQLLRSRPNRD